MIEPVFSVSDFVAVFNQTLEAVYPSVTIVGELSNFKISKNKWVYFDLKDEYSSIRFFGTIYALPGPLEDGMILEVVGQPRLHASFGFSVNVRTVRPVGEGSIKKAAQLLEAKLEAEGLFAVERKRPIPYPPKRIALVTSLQSAAYADFLKVLGKRWSGLQIDLYDVQVQGEAAAGQIVEAMQYFNSAPNLPDVIVVTRGGGSADDLAVFNTEQVTRAVAASRAPTLLAIGHETDVSLAERAADQRASTPSNAAELLVPDRLSEKQRLSLTEASLSQQVTGVIMQKREELQHKQRALLVALQGIWQQSSAHLSASKDILQALNPHAVLARGYSITRDKTGRIIRTTKGLAKGQALSIQLHEGGFGVRVDKIQ